MDPRELAESILSEHEARRAAAGGEWRWSSDPEWTALVALAAMAVSWDLPADRFEAKLERLRHMPGGTAAPAGS